MEMRLLLRGKCAMETESKSFKAFPLPPECSSPSLRRSLSDPAEEVRVLAAQSLGMLATLTMRPDPLLAELATACSAVHRWGALVWIHDHERPQMPGTLLHAA